MSYTLTLQCGCLVYVACHPGTETAHTRIIERRGQACGVRKHDIGTRLYLWEMLPEVVNKDTRVRGNRIEWM